MPTVVEMSDNVYRHCDGAIYGPYVACIVIYEFLQPEVDPAIAILTWEGKALNALNFNFQVWDGTGWNTRIRLLESATDQWFNYTFTSDELAQNPRVRFLVVANIDPDFDIDLLTFRSWTDISEMEKELERLKKRIGDIDDTGGYIENPPNEPYIPYEPSGFLLDGSVIFADPYVSWIYQIKDSQDPAASNAHVQIYPATAADYNILEDEMTWGWPGAATQIWINDTTPAIIFSTVDNSYNSWDLVANNVTIAGEALTFDTLGDASRSVRRALVKVTDFFDWSINTQTMLHTATVSITNTLGIDATRLQTYVASNPDYTVDESTVVIEDLTNGITLEAGLHYSVDASGFALAVAFWNDTDQVSYSIEYNIYTPATEVLEISCQVAGPSVTTAYWMNKEFQFSTASCYNANTFDVRGRVVLDWSLIREDVDYDGVIILDAAGKRYSDIYPLTTKKIAVEGVSVPMSETVILDLYFRTISTGQDPWVLFQKWGIWIWSLSLVAAIITTVPLMTKEKRDPVTHMRLDKDRRKMLRRWSLSFLFIFAGSLIAWCFAISLS